jgi:hypothetical protein
VSARPCRVSFIDAAGLEHAVEVAAGALYEAAVLALAEFRGCGFTEATFGTGTRLTIKVKAPETEHMVSVGRLYSWLDCVGKSPNEQVSKSRLKAILGK